MPTQSDIGEPVFEGRRNSSACRLYDASGMGAERLHQWPMVRSTTTLYNVSRHRNLSGPCCTGAPRPITLDNRALATPPPGVPGSRCERESRGEREHGSHHHSKEGSSSSSGGRHMGSHRKLDRSLSDSEDRINGNGRGGVNSSRYKTELCRPFEESGHCKYGDKCQFAHGAHELRNLTRHPKYKTERCRTYHTIGFCPYGPRCHFIHEENLDNQRKTYIRPPGGSGPGGKPSPFILSHASNTLLAAHRPSNLSGLNSLGSSFESVSSSSTPGNLSPSHLEDQFPPIGTFSPSDVSTSLALSDVDSDAVPPGSVFNFPASDAASLGSILTPLNIQTQQMYSNVMDMAALARFSAVLNISQNQHNNQSSYFNLNVSKGNQQHQDAVFEPEISSALENCSWPLGQAVPPSSNSPLSLSDDSMGSNGSLELSGAQSRLDNAEHVINSPLDVGRSMRLPIFNRFSTEES